MYSYQLVSRGSDDGEQVSFGRMGVPVVEVRWIYSASKCTAANNPGKVPNCFLRWSLGLANAETNVSSSWTLLDCVELPRS